MGVFQTHLTCCKLAHKYFTVELRCFRAPPTTRVSQLRNNPKTEQLLLRMSAMFTLRFCKSAGRYCLHKNSVSTRGVAFSKLVLQRCYETRYCSNTHYLRHEMLDYPSSYNTSDIIWPILMCRALLPGPFPAIIYDIS